MNAILSILVMLTGSWASASGIWQTGHKFEGVVDYREVMPGVLYRGGSGGARTAMSSRQLGAVCEKGISTLFYLYALGFRGNSTQSCTGNIIEYRMKNWDGSGLSDIHQAVYSSIKNGSGPVMIHCWYGIHATGMVAATSLMQFCGVSAETAIKYWKVGIVPKLQYPKIIEKIRNFKVNPALQITPAEQVTVCPQM